MEDKTEMAKKTKAATEVNDTQLADAVRNSAQQIWQAGLGALVRAQREGGDAFAKLVKDGAEVQHRTQQMAGEKFSGVALTVARLADTLGKQAAGSWEKIGNAVEDRVSRSLQGLGIPSQDDIHALTRQIEELNKSVNSLLGREAPVKRKVTATAKAGGRKSLPSAEKKPVTAKVGLAAPKTVRSRKAMRVAPAPEVVATSTAA